MTDELDGALSDDVQDVTENTGTTVGVINPGEPTEVFSAYDRTGNILSNVEFTMSDGRVFTSDPQGHVVLPAGMDFSCDFLTSRIA